MTPKFIKPMLCSDAKKYGIELGDSRYIAEPKMDGERLQLWLKRGADPVIFSRLANRRESDKKLEWTKNLKSDFTLVVLDAEGHDGEGQSAAGEGAVSTAGLLNPYSITVFDILYLNDTNLMGCTWETRRWWLEEVMRKIQVPDGYVFRESVYVPPEQHSGLWGAWVERFKGEGLVLKRKGAPWVPGQRAENWLKVPKMERVDVVITGASTKPSYTDAYRTCEAAATYGFYINGKLVTTGQGLVFGSVEYLNGLKNLVLEAECRGVTPKGGLRFGQFVRWRDDKRPEDCVKPY